MAEFLEALPELETIIVDATEQERGQPKPCPKQQSGKKPRTSGSNFSKKKGQHTLKTQLAVALNGVLVHQGSSVPGRMHDAALLKRSRLMGGVPEHIQCYVDKGYEGMAKVFTRHAFTTSTKRPKGGDLTSEQRETNRLISKVRIRSGERDRSHQEVSGDKRVLSQ